MGCLCCAASLSVGRPSASPVMISRCWRISGSANYGTSAIGVFVLHGDLHIRQVGSSGPVSLCQGHGHGSKFKVAGRKTSLKWWSVRPRLGFFSRAWNRPARFSADVVRHDQTVTIVLLKCSFSGMLWCLRGYVGFVWIDRIDFPPWRLCEHKRPQH